MHPRVFFISKKNKTKKSLTIISSLNILYVTKLENINVITNTTQYLFCLFPIIILLCLIFLTCAKHDWIVSLILSTRQVHEVCQLTPKTNLHWSSKHSNTKVPQLSNLRAYQRQSTHTYLILNRISSVHAPSE